MDLSQITPLILTYNEAPNIGRTLDRLAWAKEIVVVDSFSTDETLDIAKRFPQVRLLQRKFDSFAEQCNFGLEQVRTEWVLSLDADYLISTELLTQVKSLDFKNGVAGYSVPFRYCIKDRPLRASLYPARTVLYRKSKARYTNEGHGHRVRIEGPLEALSGWIDHDDRKPLDRWLQEQARYVRIEAEHLLNTPAHELNFPDRLRRKIVIAPFLVFFYTLLGKGLILDGWAGCYYVLQRTLAEILLSLRLIETRLETARS